MAKTRTLTKTSNVATASTTNSSLFLQSKSLPISVKKANEVVVIRIDGAEKFTASVQLLWTTLIFHTQRPEYRVAPPPPCEEVPNPELYNWVTAKGLLKTLGLSGRNYQVLAQKFEVLLNTKIGTLSENIFSRSNFIGSYVFIKGSGKRPTIVGWNFPEKAVKTLTNPTEYTNEPLDELLTFTRNHELTLYSIALRYLTAPGGLTVKQPWTVWYEVLTGNPEGSAELYIAKSNPVDAYRYFKRDVVVPAMAACWRRLIGVTLLESKNKEIPELQFAVGNVVRKEIGVKGDWELVASNASTEELQEATESLRETIQLRIQAPKKEIDKLFSKFDVNKIFRNFRYFTECVKTEKITSPIAYLYNACKHDYASEQIAKEQSDSKGVVDSQAEEIEDTGSAEIIELATNTYESQSALKRAQKLANKCVVPNTEKILTKADAEEIEVKRAKVLEAFQEVREEASQSTFNFGESPVIQKAAKTKSVKSTKVAKKTTTTSSAKKPHAVASAPAPEPAPRAVAKPKATTKAQAADASATQVAQLAQTAFQATASIAAPASPEISISELHARAQQELLAQKDAESQRLQVEYSARFSELPDVRKAELIESFKREFPRSIPRGRSFESSRPAQIMFYSKYLPSVLG